MKIEDVSFKFPVKKTLELTYAGVKAILNGDYDFDITSDTDLKLVILVNEEQKKSINEDKLKEMILSECTYIMSVKIVYDMQRTFAVRSKSIIEARSTEDKLKEYLKVNNIAADDTLIEKCKQIEDMQDIKYFNPHHTFTLLKLKLVGAIGIYKKSGRKEIEIDFRNYDEGIIALCGENGRGKTTVIENCHPYPQMLTRTGKLQSHFFLKDSLRELTYVDEEGTYYRITINIDGATKTGKCKYFVACGKDINVLTGIKDLDGNVDPYTQWVNENFGPLSLFLRTAFFAKEQTGNVPDISRATKGEKKELFSTLIGIDYLSNLQETARLKIKELKKELDKATAQYDDSDFAKIRKELGLKLLDNEQQVTFKRTSSDTLRKEIDELKGKIRDIPDSHTAEEKKRVLANRISELKDVLEILEENDIDNINTQLSDLSELSQLREQWQEYNTERFLPALKKNQEYENKIRDLDVEIYKAKQNCERLAKESAEIIDTCPTCGQKLPQSEIDILTKKAEEARAELVKETKKHLGLLEEQKNIKGFQDILDFSSISATNNKMGEDVSSLEERCRNYQPADSLREIKIMFGTYRVDEVKSDIAEQELELKALSEKTSETKDELREELSHKERRLEALQSETEELLVSNGKLKQQIESAREQEELNRECSLKIAELNHEISEYSLLDTAFGANGIQALELEAFAPDVADTTNTILNAAYGDRFKVSFQTLREGADGHLIEDFNIMIEDTSNGMVTPLEWLSSGESVWIKEALYNAFSIIRMKSTHFNFRTRFLDEADGSLDTEARMKYLKMIKAAHDESEVYQTILITHSQEVKDIVESKIEL